MFYTRLLLNLRHPALTTDRGNAYKQHRRIESLFPEKKRSDAGVLFRWEQEAIIVQSQVEPRFDLLPKNFVSDIRTKEVHLNQLIRSGQWLQFRLLADTTGIEGQARRRIARSPETLPGWLTQRLIGAAELDDSLEIRQHSHIVVQRSSQHWKLKPTSFTGYLQVTDPDLLAIAIATGFGRSRSYGCGLMQIAPAEEAGKP